MAKEMKKKHRLIITGVQSSGMTGGLNTRIERKMYIHGAAIICTRCNEEIINPSFGRGFAERNMEKLLCQRCFEIIKYGRVQRVKDLLPKKVTRCVSVKAIVNRAVGQTLKIGSHGNTH